MINLKNKAYRDFKRTPTDSKKLYYLELKNYLCTAIKDEKKAYYASQFNIYKNNSKEFWNRIKSLIFLEMTHQSCLIS